MQYTAAEPEEKISDEVVESVPQINPEISTLQSTSIPEGLNIDEDSSANPDGILDEPNPDGGSTVNPDAHDSEEINPEQVDEEKKVSRLKIYVYQNDIMSREKIREAVNEALKRYIYNIKKFKERWRKPIPADKDADRRRHFPPRPRRESKFTPDYEKMIKFFQKKD